MHHATSPRFQVMKIKNIHISIALAAATLSVGALASNHIVDIAWSHDGRFAHQAKITAGKFVEVCGKLAAGNGIRWAFTADAPVDFNIHYHLGNETVFPARLTQVAAGRDKLIVAVARDHCWMWLNMGSATVSLVVELAR